MSEPQTPTRLERLFRLERSERELVGWAAGLNFFFFAGYYTLRPVRDEIASQYLELRSELFGFTFVATVLAALAFAALTRRVSRKRLVPGTFFFLALNLALLRVLLPNTQVPTLEAGSAPFVERFFFVWVSVFVLIGVSVLWSLLSDSFRSEQAKRVFGLFFFGSTLGQVSASTFVLLSTPSWKRSDLLSVALVLVVGAALCATRIVALNSGRDANTARPIQGGMWNGLRAIVSSSQLRRICLYLATYTFGSTILYYVKTDLVREALEVRGERISFFAQLDLTIGACSLLPQLFLTNRVISRVGLARTLMILPAAGVLGFALLALVPGFVVIVIFESARRSLNFIFAKPSREVLYTGVSTEERFQAKPVIDTAWVRGTEWVESAMLDGLASTASTTAWLGVPIAFAGLWLGYSLGRSHDAQAGSGGEHPPRKRP